MKISIITICFNSDKTIARTIESVIDQNYPDLEYIIIDGGSTDGTLDIIKKYNSKISYFISEPDKGISDAFNKGIKAATGEVIGILNSDDWHESKTLEIVSSLLTAEEADFLVGALRYHNENGDNFVVLPDKDYQNSITYKMPHLNHPAAFIKSDVYRSVGLFDLKYRYAMDYDFFFRAFKAKKKGIFTDEILSNMSLSGASDKHAARAYGESLDIASNKFLAFFYYIYSVEKFYFRQLLIAAKFDKLLFYIRKRKYKN